MTRDRDQAWPELPFETWKDTCATLHLWTQVVGKVRLAKTPWVNHSWHVALYVTPRGLTTGTIPDGRRSLQLDLDLVDHQLLVATSDGRLERVALEPKSVATFHGEVMAALDRLGVEARIDERPNEVPDGIPFSQDHVHASYDREAVDRFRRALASADRVLREFRTSFLGKCSPVHFFWGSFDLAVTRFSGRDAPPHPGGVPALPDTVAREAYSHEVSSAGWWPGGGMTDYPAFYSYAYPEPEGYRTAPLEPAVAWFDEGLGEYLLRYDDVRASADPEATLLAFLRSTYAAAANAAGWDRAALECAPGRPGVPRAL
jgi:hypothetical protein